MPPPARRRSPERPASAHAGRRTAKVSDMHARLLASRGARGSASHSKKRFFIHGPTDAPVVGVRSAQQPPPFGGGSGAEVGEVCRPSPSSPPENRFFIKDKLVPITTGQNPVGFVSMKGFCRVRISTRSTYLNYLPTICLPEQLTLSQKFCASENSNAHLPHRSPLDQGTAKKPNKHERTKHDQS